ncbi:MAG: DNA replication and repair protein RecF [Candidatus Saccharibacteria bacterium]
MIANLRLQHFRSYADDSFELDPGVNIIVGPNASGKTNLLEAILVVASGSSYRARDQELLRADQPWARLDSLDSLGNNRTVKFTREPTPGKSYELDGKVYARLTLSHRLPIVLFEPNHLQLLVGSPEQRRNYLDDLLEQTLAGYGSLRRQYKRTLAQRNSLLKQDGASLATQLFPWNVRLSELAGQIVQARSQLVSELNLEIGGLYGDLSRARTRISLRYDGRWPADVYDSQLLHKLEASVELDRLRGFTAAGPHREDLSVLFDGRLAADVASRGETRTAVLALKLLELQRLQASRDVAPLLLLDDVFSELDGARRRALTNYLKDYQTFITTTDADVVLQHFTETCHIIPLGG